ncbi:NADPH-dependent FMN reductase [Leadbettera azotonutricia]|uniref:Flavin reductase n=1 Tax=Leadbettera azotonutricia (strain ATCC BAA-888 / DSM 13862 / ZAS-9) TaxID=545695 RepID=F5YA92_LEAAZ|nr:NAD(P)H-dependent oxidoreductase [Leadbettera azotonutricia]AEF83273.1 flavin reductase [Leadbettera azotonutricia ZAS-9]
MSKLQIGVLVGSLRKESFSKKTALYVSSLMPDTFDMKPLEIGNLAMFNQDYDDEGKTPGEWTTFREEVRALDGVLLVSPEYNRSIPPVIKNALDIASRPYGKNAWSGKPGGIISVSPGKLGGFGANHQLRQAVVFLNIFLLQQPEAYIGDIASLFDEKGGISNQGTADFLRIYADAFAQWVLKFRG